MKKLVLVYMLSMGSLARAQSAPPMGSAQNFVVLGASTVTNTGPTIITGDLGVSPGTAVTGFPPGTVTGGTIHAGDATAAGSGRCAHCIRGSGCRALRDQLDWEGSRYQSRRGHALAWRLLF